MPVAAELDILKVGNEPGMIGGLLQIIGRTALTCVSTRQSCSVWLKNRVHGTYSIDPATRRPNQPSITEPDREALRANILPLLAASPSRSITVQLANSLKDIVAHDLPNARWPGLIDAIKQLLVSGDIRHVQAGCVASLEVVRAFRFRQKADVLPHDADTAFRCPGNPRNAPSHPQNIPDEHCR
ncbi:Importin N-terminal domain-containing protein [Mycena indigotica]|uniref:Importin N-terminal domain-containing protein n=1 Tax=Mycena indigotica TaxID=2126181 RepID=A0A8H6RZP6_9AGAR|nr:Importin N-terminal domain-containing protein [Mycena indigotica]KAF7290269.1 Importin N-terminal domain-containing protein [Mycena indigotica]